MMSDPGAIVLVEAGRRPDPPPAFDSVLADSLDALAHFNKSLVGRVGDAREEARALKAKFREEASRNRDAQDQVAQILRDTTMERKVLLSSMNAIAAAVESPSAATSATLDRVKEEVRRVRDFLQTSMKKATLDMQGMESKLKLSQKEAALLLDKMTTQNRYAIPVLEDEVGVFESKSSELDAVLQLTAASSSSDSARDSAPSPTRRSLDTAFEQVDPLVEKDAELAALRARLAEQARLHEEALHTAAMRLEQSTILAGRDKAALEAEVARLEAALAAGRVEEERLEAALGASQAELAAANDEAVAAMRYAQDMLANVEASRAQVQTASYQQRAAAEEMAALQEAAEAGRGALEAALETERDKTRFLQQELVALRQDMSESLGTVQALESKTRTDAQRAAEDDDERRRLLRVLDQLTDQLTAAHDENKQARAQAEAAEEKFLAELQTLLEANRLLEDEVSTLHYEAAEHHARANDALRRMAAAKELELEMEMEDLRTLGSPPRTPSRSGSAQGTPSRSVMFGDDAPGPLAARSSSADAGGLGASLDSGSGSGLGIDTSGDFDLLGHSYAADRPDILQRQVDQLQKDNEALAEAMAASKAQMDAALTIVRVELGEVKDRHAAKHDELESERLKTASLERLLRQHMQDAVAPPPSPAKSPMAQEQERLLEKMFDSVERERLRLTEKSEELEKQLRICETGKVLFQTACKSAKTEATALQQALEQQKKSAAAERQDLDRELKEARDKLAEERATVSGQFAVMAKLTADFQSAKAEADECKKALEAQTTASAKREEEAAEAARVEAEALRLASAEAAQAASEREKEAEARHAKARKAAQQEVAALSAKLTAEKALSAQYKTASEQVSIKAAQLAADLDTHRDASARKDEIISKHLESRTASESRAQELNAALEQQRAVADTQNMMLGIHSTDLHMAKLALDKERQGLLDCEVESARREAALRNELQQVAAALEKEKEAARMHAEAREKAHTELEAAAQSLVVVQSTSAKHALSSQDLSSQLAAARAELAGQAEAARQLALISTTTEGRLSHDLFEAKKEHFDAKKELLEVKKELLQRDGALAQEREAASKLAAALAAAQSELAAASKDLVSAQQQAALSAKAESSLIAERAVYTSTSELERDVLQRRLQEVLASGASLSSRMRHAEGALRASQQACAAAEKKALDAEHARQLAQLRVEAQDEDLARLRVPPVTLRDAGCSTEPLAALSVPAPESPPSPAHNRLVAAALSENRARDQALAESLERCRLAEAELGTLRHATSQVQEGQLEALRAAERSLAAERAATQHATTVAAQMEKELRSEADAVRQSLRRVEVEKSELSERLESVNLQLLARHKEATEAAAARVNSGGDNSSSSSSGGGSSGSSAVGTPSGDRSAKALTRAIDELRTKRGELAKLRLESTVSANAMREEMATKERLLAEKEAERARLATKLAELEGLLEEVERRFAEAGGSAEMGSLAAAGAGGVSRPIAMSSSGRGVQSISPTPRRNLALAWQPGASLLKAKLPAAYLGTGMNISMLARAGDESFSSDTLRTPARDLRAQSDAISPVSFALEEELEEVDFSIMQDEQDEVAGDVEGSNRDSPRRTSSAAPAGQGQEQAQVQSQGQPLDRERQSQLRRLAALSARNSEAYRPTPSSAQRPESSFNFFQAIPLPFFGFQAAGSSDSQDSAGSVAVLGANDGSSSSSATAAGDKDPAAPAAAESEELITCRRELQFTLSRLEATMQSKQRLALSAAATQRESDARIQSLEEQVRALLKDLQAFGYVNVAASRDSCSDAGGGDGAATVFDASEGGGPYVSQSASSPPPTPRRAAASSTPSGPDRADRVAELERELKVARANSKMSTSAAQRAASATAIEMRVLRAELGDSQLKARHAIDECAALQAQAAAAEEEYAKAAHLLLETVESSRKSQERRVDELSADLAKMKDRARSYRSKCEQVLVKRREEREAYRKEVEHLRRSLLALRERGLLRSGEGDSGSGGEDDDQDDSGDDHSSNVFSVFSVASSIQNGVEDVV